MTDISTVTRAHKNTHLPRVFLCAVDCHDCCTVQEARLTQLEPPVIEEEEEEEWEGEGVGVAEEGDTTPTSPVEGEGSEEEEEEGVDEEFEKAFGSEDENED